jgi:hypothetical protein
LRRVVRFDRRSLGYLPLETPRVEFELHVDGITRSQLLLGQRDRGASATRANARDPKCIRTNVIGPVCVDYR